MRYADEAVSTATWRLPYPELTDPDGQLIPNGPMAPAGKADLFAFSESQRDFHRRHLRPGVRGCFVEGGRRVVVGEVADVLSLQQP